MSLVQLRAVGRRGLGCLLILLALSGCSAAYRFQYHYTQVAPPGSPGGIEDTQVRIRLAPTEEAGVLQLAVANKSLYPVDIMWHQTYYLDPLGRPRAAVDTAAQAFVQAPTRRAPVTPVAPGAEYTTVVRAGIVPVTRPSHVWRTADVADTRLPPDEEAYVLAPQGGQITVNPFTISRFSGGEVALSTAPPPFLPASGDTPTLAQAYQGREFRFILALRFDTGVTPYTFAFRITNVDVLQ